MVLCVFAEGSNTPARAQKKTDPTGTILRAGECLDSVASGRTSLDHRGDSPENGKPGWRYPAEAGHFMMRLRREKLKERYIQPSYPI